MIVRNDALIYNITKSCGCLQKEINDSYGEINKTHDMSKTRFYKIWQHIKDRCLNPNNDKYYRYGGRNISVCNKWMNFEGFYEDMYESYTEMKNIYGEENISIDRINNNDTYYKENCRWTIREVQSRNRECNKYYSIDGKIMSLADVVRDYAAPGLTYNTVYSRLYRGYNIKDALITDLSHLSHKCDSKKEVNIRRPIYFDIKDKNIVEVPK